MNSDNKELLEALQFASQDLESIASGMDGFNVLALFLVLSMCAIIIQFFRLKKNDHLAIVSLILQMIALYLILDALILTGFLPYGILGLTLSNIAIVFLLSRKFRGGHLREAWTLRSEDQKEENQGRELPMDSKRQ